MATDNEGLETEKELTITVMNVDELGKLTLSTIQPTIAREVTAILTDPDNGINNAAWQWYAYETKPGRARPRRDSGR